MENIRAKLKRRLSHKDQNANFDEHDSGDDETNAYAEKEAEEAEKNDAEGYGKSGSFLNRLILHGNKKTEDQLAREAAERNPPTGGTGATDKQFTQQ